MNYFYKSRFLLFLIFILVLLNLGTLIFMWLSRPPMPDRQGGRGENAGKFLVEQVGFNAEQQEKYSQLREAHQEMAHQTQDSLRFYKNSLFDNLPTRDSIAADRASANIARLQRKLEMNTFNHFVAVRNLCTAEQTKKFDAIIEDVLKMMAPSQGPPRQRP